MSKINIQLKEVLDQLGISPNKFAVESKIRSNTIYDLVNNKTKLITWKTLIAIIETLNRMAKAQGENKKYSVEDIIKYEDKN